MSEYLAELSISFGSTRIVFRLMKDCLNQWEVSVIPEGDSSQPPPQTFIETFATHPNVAIALGIYQQWKDGTLNCEKIR